MSLHKTFRKDQERVWLRATPEVEVLCSFVDARSPQWQNKLNEHTRPVRKLIEHNALPADKDRLFAIRTFIDLCCHDWRTVLEDGITRPEVEVKEGEWAAFSKEDAERAFVAYPSFYLSCVDLAADLKQFQLSEDARKN